MPTIWLALSTPQQIIVISRIPQTHLLLCSFFSLPFPEWSWEVGALLCPSVQAQLPHCALLSSNPLPNLAREAKRWLADGARSVRGRQMAIAALRQILGQPVQSLEKQVCSRWVSAMLCWVQKRFWKWSSASLLSTKGTDSRSARSVLL